MLLDPEVLDGYQDGLREAITRERVDEIVRLSQFLSSPLLADLLLEAPQELIINVLGALSGDRSGRIFGHFPPPFAARIAEGLSNEQAVELLKQTPLDQAADVLQVMPTEEADQILEGMGGDFKKKLGELRRYPDGTAGSVMEPKFLSARPNMTVGSLRKVLIDYPREYERTRDIYLVDEEGKLKGFAPIQELFRQPTDKSVGEVMDPELVAFRVDDSAQRAAQLLQNRRLAAVPIIDADGVLVGVLTFEDAIDILSQEVAEQFVRAGAVRRDESFFTPPMQAVRGRLPWMAFNVFLNLGAVAVITGFEDTIAQVAILAAFLPMITDMGGNVGIQSLSVSIRSIALDEVRLRDFWKGVRKEVFIGLINGAALGTLFAVLAWVMQGSPMLGVIAGVALGCNVLLAGVVGGTLPFIIKRLGKDPAMMTGPFLTTITDITGVTIYLGLATLFLTDLIGVGVLG